jgi:hypothetical protein
MSDSEPAWHLLPGRSLEFFDLKDEFTLQQLRSAYNRLIKRYKPETYPAEFQRIRGAYELLSQQLRYGDPSRQSSPFESVEFAWETATQKPTEPPGDRPSQQTRIEEPADRESASEHEPDAPQFEPRISEHRPVNHDFESRFAEPQINGPQPDTIIPLSVQNAEARYRDFSDREEKTPFDYYYLAILSEVVDPQPRCFIEWVLTGIGESNNDPGLTRLAKEFFAEVASVEDALAYARLTSEYVRNDTYYSLTEKLWERVLREAPFSVFERELESCEGSLLDHLSHHQRVFYLKLLRIAIWRADNDWPEKKLIDIGSIEQRMGAWADQELHFLDQVLFYKAHRNTFVSAGPMASQIDQAIVHYCINDELAADQVFIECQQILANAPDDLMADFPIAKSRFVAVRTVWDLIAREMTQRYGELPEDFNPETLRRKVRALAYELEVESAAKSYSRLFDAGIGAIMFIDLLIVITGIFRMFVYGFMQLEFLTVIVDLLLMCGAVVLSLVPGMLLNWGADCAIARYYQSYLRRTVLAFFEVGGIRIEDVVQELKIADDLEIEGESLRHAGSFSTAVADDWAVYFYATAHSVLKSMEHR